MFDVFALRHLLLAVASVALLIGGGYGAVTGAQSMDTCGGSVLVAESVDEADANEAENRVAFSDLTATRQDLAERAIDGERPAVDAETWPWFESAVVVEYRGEYYRFYTVTTECPVPPSLIMGVGALGILAGVAGFALTGRGFVRERQGGSA